jgi:hypothetical protein
VWLTDGRSPMSESRVQMKVKLEAPFTPPAKQASLGEETHAH